MLNIRISWLLNDMLHVNLNIKLYLYFKSNWNTCYLTLLSFLTLFFSIHLYRVCMWMCVSGGVGMPMFGYAMLCSACVEVRGPPMGWLLSFQYVGPRYWTGSLGLTQSAITWWAIPPFYLILPMNIPICWCSDTYAANVKLAASICFSLYYWSHK